MAVILLLLVLSISIAGFFLFAFLWNVKTGQYDDAQSPPLRILFDHMTEPNKKEPSAPSQKSDTCN